MATSLLTQNNLISKVIRMDSALTTSFVVSEVMNIQGANQVQLLVSFVKGNSSGCKLRIEYSVDQVSWYQESIYNESPLSNEITHNAVIRKIEETGSYVLSIPVSSCYMRVWAQAIDSGNNTSLSIIATAASI